MNLSTLKTRLTNKNLNQLLKISPALLGLDKKTLSTTNKLRAVEIPQSLTPTRSIFYVPASDAKKLAKIWSTSADCVVLDCEDGVALNRKQEARANIRRLYDTEQRIQLDPQGKYTVRLNAPNTSLAEDDIATLFGVDTASKYSDSVPKCLFIPKTNSAEDVKWLYEKLSNSFKSELETLRLFFYMESATSLINLRQIIETGLALSAEKYRNVFRLEGFVFGSDDFCADISATRTADASELVYARQKMVAYCKAYKLKAIDMVYINFKDLDGLRLQSEQGFRMGFTGKQVIHPAQIEVTQQAFTPSKERIDWAVGLIEAFKEHQKSGAGAFTYKGQMIDMPSLLQARNIIAIVERVQK